MAREIPRGRFLRLALASVFAACTNPTAAVNGFSAENVKPQETSIPSHPEFFLARDTVVLNASNLRLNISDINLNFLTRDPEMGINATDEHTYFLFVYSGNYQLAHELVASHQELINSAAQAHARKYNKIPNYGMLIINSDDILEAIKNRPVTQTALELLSTDMGLYLSNAVIKGFKNHARKLRGERELELTEKDRKIILTHQPIKIVRLSQEAISDILPALKERGFSPKRE